jgi:hypothetical protein
MSTGLIVFGAFILVFCVVLLVMDHYRWRNKE